MQRVLAVLGCLALAGLAAARPVNAATDLTGRVLGNDGNPLAKAAVFIYTAAPRVGISPFCPSCYVDCGKFRTTNREGAFRIPALSDSLLFRVLVTARGHEPTFVARVDPQAGPIEVRLAQRDPSRIDPKLGLQGRVVDRFGKPVMGATVTPVGYHRGDTLMFGLMPGTDPLSITDERGRFAIASAVSGATWFLSLKARGLAPRALQQVRPGREARIELSGGATVTGRILNGGRPVAGVAIGLVQADRRSESYVGRDEIGTDDQGRFTFSNVAPALTYLVFAKMSSLGAVGAVPAESLVVGADGTTANAGDLNVRPAHRLRGRVVLSDGGQVPPGTRALLVTRDGSDALVVQLDPEGRFEAVGVPTDSIEIRALVRGYRVAPSNAGFDPINASSVMVFVGNDVDDFELLLEPGKPQRQGYASPPGAKRP